MKLKAWLGLIALQIFGVFWAIWIFSSPLPRPYAGLIAGLMFIVVGIAPLVILRKNPQRYHWVTFWAALLFLVFSALPILGLRLLFWGQEFSQIQVGFLRGASLHSWSESFYMGMFVATFWDGFRFFFLKKFQKTKKGA